MSGVNYCPNPSFESNLTGVTFTNCSGTRVATAAPGTGNYSAQLVASGGNVMSMSMTISGLSVGKRYNASFYYDIISQTSNFVMQASVGQWPGIIQKSTSQVGYQRTWVAFTATAVSVTLVIASTLSNTAGDTVLIDRIKVSDGEHMGPYFDGNYPYCAWTGTVNNSISTSSSFTISSSAGGEFTEDPIVANGLCLNNLAWNIISKAGRYTLPGMRGSNTTVPGQRGQLFVKNKPVDVGIWTIQLFILGAFPDGTAPSSNEMKRLFDINYNQLMQNVMSVTNPIKIVAWQSDGSVRTASGTIGASVSPDLQAGGRRGEITLAFEILEGAWSDALPAIINGTAGSHWSNDIILLTALANGSAPIENSVITITGPVSNPRITDPVSGTWVQYNGTLASSDSLVIDCGAWTATLNGTTGVLSSIQHMGHPRFLVIDPGSSTRIPQVTMTGTSTGTTTNLNITAARQHWIA